MTSVFEDRLWEALKQEAGRSGLDGPEMAFFPRRRRVVTARRTGAVLAAAAAVGVSLALLPSGGSTPAYAVESQQGGAVKISFNRLDHLSRPKVEALESDLRKAGLNVVNNASTPYRCRATTEPEGMASPDFVMTPHPPLGEWGEGEVIVSGARETHAGPISQQTFTLHRGDTAFFNVAYDKRSVRFSIEFDVASCVPATGSRS
jgi:hypothetical protein